MSEWERFMIDRGWAGLSGEQSSLSPPLDLSNSNAPSIARTFVASPLQCRFASLKMIPQISSAKGSSCQFVTQGESRQGMATELLPCIDYG